MIGELVCSAFRRFIELGNGLLNGAAWVINLAVAEWAIRLARAVRPPPRDVEPVR